MDKQAFELLVALATAMPEYRSGQGRGYPLSAWYGNDVIAVVVDYDYDGVAQRVQQVGTMTMYMSD